MAFKVITNCKSADEVSARIEKFIEDYRIELDTMSKSTFMEHVVGLANTKLQKWNSLEEESGSLWSEIVEGRFDFEVHRNEVEALKKVTKEDVLKAFDEYLSATSKKRCKLEVRAVGENCSDRPQMSPDDYDNEVSNYHKLCNHKTFGKIY